MWRARARLACKQTATSSCRTPPPGWASGTNGKAVTHVIMQPDGNLVIYNNTTPVGISDTWHAGATGGYFEIDLSAWAGAIHRADGAVDDAKGIDCLLYT